MEYLRRQSNSQKLIEELAKVELIHTASGETWFNVKTQLEKTTKSKGLLKLSLLEKILKQEKDTDYYYPQDKYRLNPRFEIKRNLYKPQAKSNPGITKIVASKKRVKYSQKKLKISTNAANMSDFV